MEFINLSLVFLVGGGGNVRGGSNLSIGNWGGVGRCGVGRCGVSGSLVSWGGVDWGGVGWGRVGFVLLLDVFGVLGLSLVFHISSVSIGISAVGDDLGAAIGESNTVRSSGDLVVRFLRVVEVIVGLGILNVITEAVWLGSLFKGKSMVLLD